MTVSGGDDLKHVVDEEVNDPIWKSIEGGPANLARLARTGHQGCGAGPLSYALNDTAHFGYKVVSEARSARSSMGRVTAAATTSECSVMLHV